MRQCSGSSTVALSHRGSNIDARTNKWDTPTPFENPSRPQQGIRQAGPVTLATSLSSRRRRSQFHGVLLLTTTVVANGHDGDDEARLIEALADTLEPSRFEYGAKGWTTVSSTTPPPAALGWLTGSASPQRTGINGGAGCALHLAVSCLAGVTCQHCDAV
jgi:hypothetical protein